MKEIKFTLVKDTGRQKFYECSLPIQKGTKNSSISSKENLQKEIQHFKKQIQGSSYELAPLLTDEGLDYICISDAKTHTERLVFPAFAINDMEKGIRIYAISSLEIAGEYTMMINGGDIETIEEPEFYLKQLTKANGYKYGGIEK